MTPPADLGGKTAVVTGASSGIGEEIARQLARAGARVAVLGRDDTRTRAVAETIRAAGYEAHPIVADLLGDGVPDQVVREALDVFGRIDILVHSAGLYEPSPLVSTPIESFDRMWAINIRVPFVLTRSAAPHMHRGGVILFVSSISGHVGFANEAAYASTKGGLDAFTRSLAVELASAGLRVNGVAPGFTETPMNEEVRKNAEIVEAAQANTLDGRLGRVEDIAASVCFLASDAADHIHGVILPVDGGYPVSRIQQGLV